MLGEWVMGDTPQSVMTTRAPAVLKSAGTEEGGNKSRESFIYLVDLFVLQEF